MINQCSEVYKMEIRRFFFFPKSGPEHKPYLCHQCGRGFGRQEHVSRHAKICGQVVASIIFLNSLTNSGPD